MKIPEKQSRAGGRGGCEPQSLGGLKFQKQMVWKGGNGFTKTNTQGKSEQRKHVQKAILPLK